MNYENRSNLLPCRDGWEQREGNYIKIKITETFASRLVETESSVLRGKSLLTSFTEITKWASAAALHEKPLPQLQTHNLILSLKLTSHWIYRAMPHLLLGQLLVLGCKQEGRRL